MNKFLNKILNNFSLVKRSINRLNKKYYEEDCWAMITGCTSGIGKSYAEILANNKFNLILISRNEEKIKNLSNKLLENNNDIKIISIIADFSKNEIYEKENYNNYLKILSEKNINLLINNVGETSFGGEFFKHDISKNKNMINVNISSSVLMTQLFINSQIKYLETNKSKQNKAIVNVSSYFGSRPVPGVSIYSSTKSFLNNFSSSLYYELKDLNFKCNVLCLNPLFVQTNMVRMKSKMVIKPEELVYSSFLRISNWKVHSYGHFKHTILSWLMNLIPNFIFCRYTHEFYKKQYNSIYIRRKRNK
jgi:short-subunit dehydrogenase